MIVLFFFSMLGRWAVAAVNLYLAHQVVFNTILVAYGLLLAVAHHTMAEIDQLLAAKTGQADGITAMRAIAGPQGEELVRIVKEKFHFPFISSGVDFAIHTVTRQSLIRLIGRKYRISNSEIVVLIRGMSQSDRS